MSFQVWFYIIRVCVLIMHSLTSSLQDQYFFSIPPFSNLVQSFCKRVHEMQCIRHVSFTLSKKAMLNCWWELGDVATFISPHTFHITVQSCFLVKSKSLCCNPSAISRYSDLGVLTNNLYRYCMLWLLIEWRWYSKVLFA